ncbi:hypothetical protein EMCRGX_G004562 [Ephydatia muelleri]
MTLTRIPLHYVIVTAVRPRTHPPSPFLPAFSWPDQTAIRITAELGKLVSQKMFAWTRVKNFESNIVQSTLDACGMKNTPTGDEDG